MIDDLNSPEGRPDNVKSHDTPEGEHIAQQGERKTKKRSHKPQRTKISLKGVNISDMLTKDEEVIVVADIHWGIYWKPALVLVLALFISVFVIQFGVILGVAGALYLSYCVVLRYMLLLILTNKRILFRYGILQVDVVDMRFKSIESVELERMLPGFLLGYANIVISGIGSRAVFIPFVGNGPIIRRAYNEMVLDQEETDEQAVERAKKAKALLSEPDDDIESSSDD